ACHECFAVCVVGRNRDDRRLYSFDEGRQTFLSVAKRRKKQDQKQGYKVGENSLFHVVNTLGKTEISCRDGESTAGDLAVSEKSQGARVEPVGRPGAGRCRSSGDIL